MKATDEVTALEFIRQEGILIRTFYQELRRGGKMPEHTAENLTVAQFFPTQVWSDGGE